MRLLWIRFAPDWTNHGVTVGWVSLSGWSLLVLPVFAPKLYSSNHSSFFQTCQRHNSQCFTRLQLHTCHFNFVLAVWTQHLVLMFVCTLYFCYVLYCNCPIAKLLKVLYSFLFYFTKEVTICKRPFVPTTNKDNVTLCGNITLFSVSSVISTVNK